jgi:hypothetical protein
MTNGGRLRRRSEGYYMRKRLGFQKLPLSPFDILRKQDTVL